MTHGQPIVAIYSLVNIENIFNGQKVLSIKYQKKSINVRIGNLTAKFLFTYEFLFASIPLANAADMKYFNVNHMLILSVLLQLLHDQ